MADPLTIVAKITAKPGEEAAVEALLKELVAPTVEESGCNQYDLHRSTEEPGIFLFYENWASKAEWDAHMASDHLQGFLRKSEGRLDGLELMQLKKI